MEVLGPDDPMVLQVKALLDMARALPRPKVKVSSPGRLPRQDVISRSSPGNSSRLINLQPIIPSPQSPQYEAIKTNSLTRQLPGPGSASSRPFDEQSAQSHGPQLTSQSVKHANNAQDVHTKQLFRTPPRNYGTAIVTPSSDRIATQYHERYRAHVASRPRSPKWLIPSSSRDEGDVNIIKSSTKVFLAPHLVPESPVRSLDAIGRYSTRANTLDSWNKAGLDKDSMTSDPKVTMMSSRFGEHSQTSELLDGRRRDPHDAQNAFPTGNSERDELLNRVKALLDDNELDG
jgi:hypothetical protein